MLSEEHVQEILQEARHYPQKRAAAAEALKIVQREHRWVNDEHLAQVAGLLEMSVDELESVATFYNLIFRRPVGRHVVLICDSVTCWIMGYENLLVALMKRLGVDSLGQTSGDGRFTLLPTACLGACDRAPAMMIDDDLHTNLDQDRLDEILARYD